VEAAAVLSRQDNIVAVSRVIEAVIYIILTEEEGRQRVEFS